MSIHILLRLLNNNDNLCLGSKLSGEPGVRDCWTLPSPVTVGWSGKKDFQMVIAVIATSLIILGIFVKSILIRVIFVYILVLVRQWSSLHLRRNILNP